MKLFTKTLWSCVVIEMIGAAVFIVVWLREPIPPRPDLSHYHSATSDEIRALEEKVFDEGTADNWLALGKMYLLFGLFPEAEYSCRQAARLDSNSFAAFYWWGVALNQIGQTSQAIEKFRQALPLAENPAGEPHAKARCWYGIGRNFLRQEDAANAEKAFREATDYLPCRHQLIRILVRSRRAAEAMPMLNDLIIHHPNESSFYQLRAKARAQLGKNEGAFDDQEHVERAPGRLQSDSIIAELQNAAGKVGVYRELRQCDRLLARNPQEAVERLRKLLAAEWRSEIAGLLVEADMRIGNAQQAVDLVKKMMVRDGTSTANLEQLANSDRWLNKHELAFELRKRIATLRHVETVHADLARDYNARGNPDLARKHRALAHMTAGITQYRQNLISEARANLQEAVQLDTELANAWYYLGECRRTQGQTTQATQATQAYRNCLKADANHGRARSRLSRLKKLKKLKNTAGKTN